MHEITASINAIGDAVNARGRILSEARAAVALTKVRPGDVVRFSDSISPQYLRGVRGRVIEVEAKKVTVCVHEPVGKFAKGLVRCAPLAFEKVEAMEEDSQHKCPSPVEEGVKQWLAGKFSGKELDEKVEEFLSGQISVDDIWARRG